MAAGPGKNLPGIEHPVSWVRNGNMWMARTMFEDIRLPLDWPVYVSHAEASAYANWLGRRLPNEEQFHRAAYGSSHHAAERQYPWGNDEPSAKTTGTGSRIGEIEVAMFR